MPRHQVSQPGQQQRIQTQKSSGKDLQSQQTGRQDKPRFFLGRSSTDRSGSNGTQEPGSSKRGFKSMLRSTWPEIDMSKTLTTIHIDSDYIDDIEITQGVVLGAIAALTAKYVIDKVYSLLCKIFGIPEAIAEAVGEAIKKLSTSVNTPIKQVSPEAMAAIGKAIVARCSYPDDDQISWLTHDLKMLTNLSPGLVDRFRKIWFDQQGNKTSSYQGISEDIRLELDAGNLIWFSDQRSKDWVASQPGS